MSEQTELQRIQQELEVLKTALMDLEPVGNSIRYAGNDIIDKVSQRGLKRIIKRILAYPSTDTPNVVDDSEGALTQAIFEKMKVVQQQISIASQINLREKFLSDKQSAEAQKGE